MVRDLPLREPFITEALRQRIEVLAWCVHAAVPVRWPVGVLNMGVEMGDRGDVSQEGKRQQAAAEVTNWVRLPD